MRYRRVLWKSFVLLLCLLAGYGIQGSRVADQPRKAEGGQIRAGKLAASYAKLPLSFESNQGQTNPRVRFVSRGSGYTLFLTGNEAVLALQKPEGREQKARGRGQGSGVRGQLQKTKDPFSFFRSQALLAPPSAGLEPGATTHNGPRATDAVLRMQLVGANPHPAVAGLDELPGKSNYFIGNDPKKWRTNVPTYTKVKYEGVYPGVDLIYYGNQRQLEYDFVVAPGADPRVITLDVGADAPRPATGERRFSLETDADGNLLVATESGEVTFHKPVVYQAESAVDSRRSKVEERSAVPGAVSSNRQSSIDDRQYLDGRYVISGDRQVTFDLASYDRDKPLVIDPVLSYSTYLGGSDLDEANAIAVDAAGNAYLAGDTVSDDFPTVRALEATHHTGYFSNYDAFVAKLNAAGNALIYSTYLGGAGSPYSTGEDLAFGIAVDAAGNAYVAGYTGSPDFPTTRGALKRTCGNNGECGPGTVDGFVSKLSPLGNALVYSTYLGGGLNDEPSGIAVDAAGNAYVVGTTDSDDFPVVKAARACVPNTTSADRPFLSKLNPAGSALVYSTCWGGELSNYGGRVAIDPAGNAYITGTATGEDFPVVNALQSAFGGDQSDGFVAKFNPSGGIVYSTYLGGSGVDEAFGITADAKGNAYVTGYTQSADFPIAKALQPKLAGASSAFVTGIRPAGSLLFSTYLGGEGADRGFDIKLSPMGSIYLTGLADSVDFPTTVHALQNINGGTGDAFISELSPSGAKLVYSTYLGGGDADEGHGIAVDAMGNVYVAGKTYSADFPTRNPVQRASGGYWDAFVTKTGFWGRVEIKPPRLVFPPQRIFTESPAQTFRVWNTGELPVNFTAISIDGDFTVKHDCGNPLQIEAYCTASVTFKPTHLGPQRGGVDIRFKELRAEQHVVLMGFGSD